jgi:hypothetical protein
MRYSLWIGQPGQIIMRTQKYDPRAEHRQRQNLRVTSSPNLAEKFRSLKSLEVDLAYYEAGGIRKTSEIKYKVNLANAKSIFSFNCNNHECVGGDFDLTEKLASAIATKLKTTEGEACCQGWRNSVAIDSLRCRNILRYKLSLKY